LPREYGAQLVIGTLLAEDVKELGWFSTERLGNALNKIREDWPIFNRTRVLGNSGEDNITSNVLWHRFHGVGVGDRCPYINSTY
jgi:hypothetical protein